MAGDDWQVWNEDQITQMIQVLRASEKQLQTVITAVDAAAKNIEAGTMIGAAADELVRGLRSTLRPAIDRMCQDLVKQAQYVQNELDQHNRASGH